MAANVSPYSSLVELAEERGLTLGVIENVIRSVPVSRPTLTRSDQDQLRRLGVDPGETSELAWLRGDFARAQLEKHSYSAPEVASILEVQPSRIRQRLGAKELLGFHRRTKQRDWFLPRFQFDLGLHDTDDWATLLQALPDFDDCAPVVLVAWLTDPQDHLAGRSRAEVVARDGAGQALVGEAASYGIVA